MLLYLLVVFGLCLTVFFIYIRAKYRFWSQQPVFHFYDLYYWFVNVGIIRPELPEKNRYVNLHKITTNSFSMLNEKTIKQLTTLIQLNYLRNNDNIFNPKLENIVPYFVGHNAETFWSYFSEPELLIDNKTGNTIKEFANIGVITSRPLHININKRGNQYLFDAYYVDYLCVHKSWRKKNIAPQLIQTHEYKQSHNNRKICVSLFKREEDLTGIIPLTTFNTYCFNMKKWRQPEGLPANISVLTGDKQNIYYLYNLINELTKNKKDKYDIIIYPEISNLIELIITQNIFVKMLLVEGNIEALYFFRKTCTFIEKNKEIISCIASIWNNKLTKIEFIQGFKNCLWSIIKDFQNFGYLTIENLGDNRHIIDNIRIKTHPMVVSPTAYFFYNFAYSPFKAEKCLILN